MEDHVVQPCFRSSAGWRGVVVRVDQLAHVGTDKGEVKVAGAKMVG